MTSDEFDTELISMGSLSSSTLNQISRPPAVVAKLLVSVGLVTAFTVVPCVTYNGSQESFVGQINLQFSTQNLNINDSGNSNPGFHYAKIETVNLDVADETHPSDSEANTAEVMEMKNDFSRAELHAIMAAYAGILLWGSVSLVSIYMTFFRYSQIQMPYLIPAFLGAVLSVRAYFAARSEVKRAGDATGARR